MTTLDIYRQQVRDAINRRDGAPILNDSVNHATVITQEVLSGAKEHVRILSYKLDASCYADPGVLGAAKVFLADPEHQIDVLIEAPLWDTHGHFEWAKHPFIETIKEARANTDRVRLVNKDMVHRYKFNFLLLDDFGYRFEADRSKAAAVAAFLPEGKTQQAERLINIFEQLFRESAPIAK